MNGEHATTSQHARLLVLLAEHMPVVGRPLFNDHPTVECACGNPLYTGHLVVLLAGLDQPGTAQDTVDGQANDCTHGSATGIDTTSPRDPAKVWRCDHCGLRWRSDGAALAAQEGDRPSVLPDLALRIEAMPGRGKSQTHLRKSDVLDLIAEVDRKWFAQTVARKGSALAAQEGDQGEAVREALDEVHRLIVNVTPPTAVARDRAWWGLSRAAEIVSEVRDRRAPETGATP